MAAAAPLSVSLETRRELSVRTTSPCRTQRVTSRGGRGAGRKRIHVAPRAETGYRTRRVTIRLQEGLGSQDSRVGRRVRRVTGDKSDVTMEAETPNLENSEGVNPEDAMAPEEENPPGSTLCPTQEEELGFPPAVEREDSGEDGEVPYGHRAGPRTDDEDGDIISDEITDLGSQGGPVLGDVCEHSDNPEGFPCGSGEASGREGPQKGQKDGRSFICSECGMFFDRHSNLLRHQRVHTGERPYVCTDCNKSYTQRADLTRHQKSHTAVKTYPCRDCGYRFAHKAQLEIHRKAHRGRTQFACAACGKCFIKYSNLLAHQQVHLQPKPEPKFFECSSCEEKFIHKSDLAKHERLHTGEKFLCFECGIRFSCISSLHRHQKIHGEGTTTE